MGCEFNFQKLEATTDAAAVDEGLRLIEQAGWENGHGGYSGSFAECTGVDLVVADVSAENVEDWLDEHAQKWGLCWS